MKKTVLILLALSLVMFMTSCDDGGSSGGGNDSSKKYVISDINPKDIIETEIEAVSGGIKFTAIGVVTIINDTITLGNSNFTNTLKITEDGTEVLNMTFTGSWTGNETSMTLNVEEEKDNIAGITQASTETWTYVVSDGGNTLTRNEAYPATDDWHPTYKKQ